ncbi:hypothetical protein AVEN_174009-1 [Araneus ventricosus]|uniref:Uncharacterized protein n=1 Tax=Araneus ventricosus TaxID=182803 RepID=A0A4Y2SPF4_ARAVE|nr:hypothetical protein AVEN_174009-1 [Araneus ventricosus]
MESESVCAKESCWSDVRLCMPLMWALRPYRGIEMRFWNFMRNIRGTVGIDFIFMGGNARPHEAQLVDDFLQNSPHKVASQIIGSEYHRTCWRSS